MLALLFRGVFLAGVVGWYSTSLWKMIDGYFKDQFQRYLEVEYQRNPKMREDVRRDYAAVDKSASGKTDESTTQELRGIILESCGLDASETCPVGEADLRDGSKDESGPTPPTLLTPTPPPPPVAVLALGTGAVEKEVDGTTPPLDAPTFHEDAANDAKPPDERVHEEEIVAVKFNGENDSLILEKTKKQLEPQPQDQEFKDRKKEQHENQQIAKLKAQQQQEEQIQKKEDHQKAQSVEEQESIKQQENQQKPKVKKKRRSNVKLRIGAPSEEAAKRKKKRLGKIKTLTLTKNDFESVSRKRKRADEEADDRDFSEFDDEDVSKPVTGDRDEDESTTIPVADLPFKPLIDIYDLERLSEEEFCPLTLEDDLSCEETRSWP